MALESNMRVACTFLKCDFFLSKHNKKKSGWVPRVLFSQKHKPNKTISSVKMHRENFFVYSNSLNALLCVLDFG